MYSSLDKIDIVARGERGVLLCQTDHRDPEEVEAEPEISVLFALVRVLNARHKMERDGETIEDVVYVAFGEPPPFLTEALAAAGAVIERPPANTRRRLERPRDSVETIVGRAFAGLAQRVSRRVGLTDPAAVLRALEAETLLDPPDKAEDEIGHWTRVLELTAVTVATIGRHHAGSWVINHTGMIPFGFTFDADRSGGVLLPANRAERFIDDGADETMFHLVSSAEEMIDRAAGRTPEGPLLPSLRSRAEARASRLLFKPLLEIDREQDELPVIAYGNDGESTFALIQGQRTPAQLEVIHREALANIRAQKVEVDERDVEGLRLVSVSGSFFATDKLLDPEFMRGLHVRLDARLLVAAVPRRGLMLVSSALQELDKTIMLIKIAALEHGKGGSRAVSPTLLTVDDGRLVGLVRPQVEEAAEPAAKGEKKPGFFRRLFKRK